MRLIPYIYGASVVNYPTTVNAFQWEGYPINNQPSSDYLIPGTVPAAEELNWLFNRITNDISTLNDMAGQIAARNWQGYVTNTVFTGSACTTPNSSPPCWDPSAGRWVQAIDAGSSITPRYSVWESIDGMNNWTRISSSTMSHAPEGLAVLPSGLVCILEYGALNTAVIQPGAMTWAEYALNGSGNNTAGQACISAFNGKFIVAYNLVGSSGAPPVVKYSTDGHTWTTVTGTFANMGTSSGGRFFVGDNMILFQYAPGTYYKSTDGITWTSVSMGLGGGVYDIFSSVCWDSLRGRWVGSAFISTDSNKWCTFFYSYDGITWTNTLTNGGGTRSFIYGLCAGDGVILAVVSQFHNLKPRVLCSVDGGTVWRFTKCQGQADGGMIGFANGQFIYFDGVGFSATQSLGLPAVATIY